MPFRDGPPGFEPLDWRRPIRKQRRKLPHWEQNGATYFITFRLADSLAADKRRELQRFREEWEAAHPAPRTEAVWEERHRETMRRIDEWLDAGSGECWLGDPACSQIVSRALHHFHEQRYFLSCYCIMPNHVHLLVTPFAGYQPSKILHSWKGFTGKELSKHLGRSGDIWEAESYDTLVRDVSHLWKAIRYIGRNPGKAGIDRAHWVRFVDPLWERAGWGFGDDNRVGG